MRIAIVNQYSSAGGGARYVRALATALVSEDRDLEVTIFADASAVQRDDIRTLIDAHPNLSVRPIGVGGARAQSSTSRLVAKAKQFAKRFDLVNKLYYRTRVNKAPSEWCHFSLDASTISELDGYEVVHIAWPYFIEPARLSSAVVVTMHDFNYKYPFGNFSAPMLELVESQVPQWLGMAGRVVVSTEFMSDELLKFYPDTVRALDVIRLTHLSVPGIAKGDSSLVVQKYQLSSPYLICPSNTSKHKNLENLLRAHAELKRRGVRLPLVLAGSNTEYIGRFRGEEYPEGHPLHQYAALTKVLNEEDLEIGVDVRTLGYVSDVDIDALIERAAILVAPSLYEAGSGPAVDAWAAGTPVAFSDIAPFREQLGFLGTQALTFDPRDPCDIADKLQAGLSDVNALRGMAATSREALSRYTWSDIARAYLKTYRAASDEHGGGEE